MIVGRTARRDYFLRCFRIIAEGKARKLVLSKDLDESDLAHDEHRLQPEPFASNSDDRTFGRDDVVFAFDFLPRFGKDRLAMIVEALAASGCTVFFVIPLAYADRVLADGSNVNKTVETREWWAELLDQAFGGIEAVKAHSEYDAAFVSRPLLKIEKRAIERLSPRIVLANELDRIGSRAVVFARQLARSIERKTALLEAVEGRSV